MKTLKGWITLTVLLAVLLIPTTGVNAGIIVTGRSMSCTEPNTGKEMDQKTALGGVIVTGLVGIIVTGLTGIIVLGASEPTENCGIIVTG